MLTGEIHYLYAFDVANEIVTQRIPEILSRTGRSLDVRADPPPSRDLPSYRSLTIQPRHDEVRVFGHSGTMLSRVFEMGVVTVNVRIPFDVVQLEELRPFHAPRLDGGEPLSAAAQRLCADVCSGVEEALVRFSPPAVPEAYTVFVVRKLDDADDANAWFASQRRAVASLLTETEAERLSDAQIEESLRIVRSFSHHNLAVIDWDASLVVDLDRSPDDVLYVLELANLQLEEFRVMDRRLDLHCERAYQDLERRMPRLFFPLRKTLDWLRRFRIDMARLNDEVTHITKFFGDWYLARVYAGAQERFHLGPWRQSVEQRLAELDRVYSMLQAEISERRMLWLEVAIVVCFIVDLLALFWWKR